MKYGVIVCPKCGMARGIEAKKKTTTCQCGRKIDLRHMKLRFMTDSPLELAGSVAKANEALRGGGPMPSERKSRKRDPYTAIAEKARSVKDQLERLRVIAIELTSLRSEFTLDDLKRIATIIGRDSAEEMLARLQEHSLVYETGDGKFRAV